MRTAEQSSRNGMGSLYADSGQPEPRSEFCGVDAPGAPKWLHSRYFNIVAKAPIPITSPAPDENYHVMLRNLLVDRFKMITHYEDRLVDVYTLVAAKPKLTKADTSVEQDVGQMARFPEFLPLLLVEM